MDVEAILFSGGKGTRLFPLTQFYQKVMIPMGESGHPLLEYIIRHIAYFGIKKITILIGYRPNQIRRYFGDGSNFDVDIKYVLDSPDSHGTAGALLNAKETIELNTMLIYYTDIISDINLSKMIDFHDSNNKVGTAWIDPSWRIPDGVISHNDNNTVESIESNPNHFLANTGISILNKSVFDLLENIKPQNDIFDLSRDVFPELAKNQEMSAFLSDDWWYDIGSLSRYKSINEKLLEKKFSHIW